MPPLTPPGPKTIPGDPGAVDRRGFLKLTGGAAALAAFEGCFRTPHEKVVPYAQRPPEVTPGVPLTYATTWSLDGEAHGILVQTFEGRPTKIEGNPDHPASLGATGVFEQALLPHLCDPSRVRVCAIAGAETAWPSLKARLSEHAGALEADGGAKLAFLIEPTASPYLEHLYAELSARFPRATFHRWSAAGDDDAITGTELAYGARLRQLPRLDQAQIVAAFGADLLEPLPAQLRLAREVASRRVDPASMSRIYVVEARLSVTGMFADERLRAKPSRILPLLLGLARALSAEHGIAPLAEIGARAPGLRAEERAFLAALASDLAAHRGEAAVLVGQGQPALAHAVAHAINDALGSTGRTLRFTAAPARTGESGPAALRDLVQRIRAGQVETLVITAWNPAYTAPADLALGDAIAAVPVSVYLAYHPDETAQRASWVVPATHPLEHWADARAPDGTLSIHQPVIRPLMGAVSELELLTALTTQPDPDPYQRLFEWYRARVANGELGVRAGGPFQEAWESWIARGFIPGSGAATVSPALDHHAVARAAAAYQPPADDGALELAFAPDYKVFDGRFCRNPWLQELPDPITKLTWDNAACLSPRTAKALGVDTGDVLGLTLDGRTVEAPAFVLPSHADGVISVTLGYGTRGPPSHVEATVGFAAYALRTSGALWFSTGLEARRTGEARSLAITQLHAGQSGRPLAVNKARDQWLADPQVLEEQRRAQEKLYDPWSYQDAEHAWAMTIDLARCTGCSACIVACQAENNIPTVGPSEVRRGRELHWIRVDRYFEAEGENPAAVTQPLMCVHCENAPCEYVCPVNATVHDGEGLNEQVYNRCVGTRYCSNNCPYKVRRFNFFNYNTDISPLERVPKNPDVTVRARGVMEKCTYCVQRIERERIRSRVAGEPMGAVQTACAQVCPSRAIVFGDLRDTGAEVVALREDPRAYALLHELGTAPRTRHLARIRNPHPALEKERSP